MADLTATAADTAGPAGPPLFDALLTPHRSLGPRGFLWLMALVAAVSATIGGWFLLRGAWPVFGLYGLDVAILWLCFRANYRAAAAFERVRVRPGLVEVTRGRGQVVDAVDTIPTAWLRVDGAAAAAAGGSVDLVGHGRRLALARMLGAEERQDFARALDAALARARLPDHLRSAGDYRR